MNSKNIFVSTLSLIVLLSFTGCVKSTSEEQLDLNNLNLTEKDPIYATYAAHMERSSFDIDQGYEFRFYNDDENVRFASEKGGNIDLSFLHNGQLIDKKSEVFKKPIISQSFPDMVSYNYQPIENLNCDVTFLVESSTSAIMDITLQNKGDKTLEFQLIPDLSNNYRPFSNIRQKGKAFSFFNEKYPDGWTRNHKLPHADTIKNIWAFSDEQASMSAATDNESFGPHLPFSIDLSSEPIFQIKGRTYKNGKERFISDPAKVRMQIAYDNNYDKILTETCPVTGRAEYAISNDFYRLELGNFGKVEAGKKYQMTWFNEQHNLYSRRTETLPELNEKSIRIDHTLKEYDLPIPPNKINAGCGKHGNYIEWENINKNYVFDLYRRELNDKIFTRIAKNVEGNHYMDEVNRGTFRYILVTIDKKTGVRGIHSKEAVRDCHDVSVDDFMYQNQAEVTYQFTTHLLFKSNVTLKKGESKKIRLVRVSGKKDVSDEKLQQTAKQLLKEDIQKYADHNNNLFKDFNKIGTYKEKDKNLLLLSSFNMMRQCFYPPEGKSSYNYYVFSREPVWGWGHGGQVFHESITMLAYALLFPESAMNSQRVYSERQYENGYINYRTGSWLDEIIEHNDQLTSSAPWYSWLNWEVYKMTKDKEFLKEMYQSSKKFYNFYTENRDADGDGLYEWGGHAILESVRDALVAVWDEVGWPSNFESLDLNCMMVNEAKALENMAKELGLDDEAKMWKNDYTELTDLINKTFWDEENGFYYNVDKKDNDFTFNKKDDLKRDEIIGFLPLWAGVASKQQAEILVKKLTDPNQFWRENGVPTLSATDSYYNAKGYWNGPIWVEWNYLIMRGLLDYGYTNEAKTLVHKNADVMIKQLKDNHNLWEFYSPDHNWAGYHKTYIWAGIIGRMLVETR